MIHTKLADYELVLRAAATRQVASHRRRRRRVRITGLAMLTVLLATGAALAGGLNVASLLPGYSVADTPVVSEADVTAALPPESAGLAQGLATVGGLDLSQLHRVRSTRFGITVLVAPSTRGQGICAAYIQREIANTQCGDATALGIGIPIITAGGTLYVGLRPDGVTSVSTVDGVRVPVVDDVFISPAPVEP